MAPRTIEPSLLGLGRSTAAASSDGASDDGDGPDDPERRRERRATGDADPHRRGAAPGLDVDAVQPEHAEPGDLGHVEGVFEHAARFDRLIDDRSS